MKESVRNTVSLFLLLLIMPFSLLSQHVIENNNQKDARQLEIVYEQAIYYYKNFQTNLVKKRSYPLKDTTQHTIILSKENKNLSKVHTKSKPVKQLRAKKNYIPYISITLLIIIIISLAVINYRQHSQLEKEKAIRQTMIYQFENLKNQVNPQILLNNLTVLSDLIKQDKVLAHQFSLQFTTFYALLLDLKNTLLINLQDEVALCKAYLLLEKIRLRNNLEINIHISTESFQDCIPPLSLQTIIEHVSKDNAPSPEKPLSLEIFDEDDKLIIIQKHSEHIIAESSLQPVLKYLIPKYELIKAELPVFTANNNNETLILPLIKNKHAQKPEVVNVYD